MKWIIPKRRDPSFGHARREVDGIHSADFNAPLAEQGCVCVAPENGVTREADDDIQSGRVRRFSNVDDLIDGLHTSW